MKRVLVLFFMISVIGTASFAQDDSKKVSGKKVFEKYCWGCHHQTAVAFGPSFAEIASKRDAETIRAMVTDPKSVSKVLGYKRSAMPPFKLNEDELKAISEYILSYKDNNKTKGGK